MSQSELFVLGIDGAPGGWVVAEVSLTSATQIEPTLTFSFINELAPCVARLDTDVSVAAIDMPIGLSADGNRPADALARERLGPRRSTFFPTPIRSLLEFDEYSDANAHSKDTTGAGLSKQAWNLLPRIRQVDSLWQPQWSDRLVEAHPETSFAEISGEPVLTKKQTPEGRTERLALLRNVFGDGIDNAVGALKTSLWVDALDAAAIAWTAQRAVSGEAIVLGGQLDPEGRPMQLTI